MAVDRRALSVENFKGAEPDGDVSRVRLMANFMKVVRSRRSISGDTHSQQNVYLIARADGERVELSQLAKFLPDSAFREFSTGEEFLQAARILGTGCAVIVTPILDVDVLAIVSWLGLERPDIASLVIAARPNVKEAVACLKAGAADYIGLPLDADEIAAAVVSALAPRPERPSRTGALARLQLTGRLSQRELQVLEGLLAGMSNKEVGAKLQISERTVEVHRSRIMRRLGVDSFAELVRISVRAGIGSV